MFKVKKKAIEVENDENEVLSIEDAEKEVNRGRFMAITAFVGTPGSGKTYEAVFSILQNLKTGRHVFTNIDGMESSTCRRFCALYCGVHETFIDTHLHWLSKKEAIEFWKHITDGSLVVIDEVHKLFSNRDWSTKSNKEFANWCSTHRHTGNEVLLITQGIEKVEPHAKSLIEWSYVFRKVNFLGSLVTARYMKHVYYSDDIKGRPLSKKVCEYQNDVFPCYKSYVASDIKEKGFIKAANILRHPVFYSIPLLFFMFIYMFFFKSSVMSGDVFGAKASQAAGMKIINEKKKSENKMVSLSNSSNNIIKEVNTVEKKEDDIESAIKNGILLVQYEDGLWTNVYQTDKVPIKKMVIKN